MGNDKDVGALLDEVASLISSPPEGGAVALHGAIGDALASHGMVAIKLTITPAHPPRSEYETLAGLPSQRSGPRLPSTEAA